MKALFDLSFTKFVAPSIARIVYILLMVVIGLFYLISVIVAFYSSVGFGLFVMVIVGPLVGLLYLVLARVGLESLIATIRTAENTAELVRLQGGAQPNAQFGPPANYPPVPPQY